MRGVCMRGRKDATTRRTPEAYAADMLQMGQPGREKAAVRVLLPRSPPAAARCGMELRHLRYFLAVAEEKHITRAAERLGMQQPPLSQQIKALEAEIGIQLFRRVPRGVGLTSGGAAFLQEVRGILSGVEHAVIKASRAAHGLEGTLLVGFSTSAIAHRLVPDLIRAYRQAYPGVALDLSGGNAAELTEAVAKGAIHAAIFRKPVVQPADVIFHSLLEEDRK